MIAGCDDAKTTTAAKYPPPPIVTQPGRISGRVTLAGPRPSRPGLISPIGDPHCMALHPNGLPDESLIVADDGSLPNTIVYLTGAPAFDGSGRQPALLNQVGCQYVPHVVTVQVNQPLQIRNSDQTLHNVHIPSIYAPTNTAMPEPGEITLHFDTPEITQAKCDVHPWMKAVIAVFDNSYFDVSGPDGRFEIDQIPPGTYTLVAWQERLGEVSQKVTVEPNGRMRVDPVFK